jgi:hypothetical protein
MEPLIDAMTYSLPLKRLITGYSLPSIPNLKKSDLSIGYKYLDTQMDFPYILEGSENPCQIRKIMNIYVRPFHRNRMHGCQIFRDKPVKNETKGD